MVLGEAVAGLASGAQAIWGYNRANYMYDREMRQEQEFQVMKFRNKQADLWREDVRDLIGLTERKMENYLVVTTLQLGMCILLFTEGRLEPGTPQWLLRVHMLTLGAAFTYLLMSAWLAMHASIVAQSAGVRLLTQLVRLPVPSWEELEATRTYASSYEGLSASHMLRVPFIGSLWQGRKRASAPSGAPPKVKPSSSPRAASSDLESGHRLSQSGAVPFPRDSSKGSDAADPWGLEREGHDIYELQPLPIATLRHINLVRRAAAHYQCYDAFARVSMTLGTNQMLNAIAYYCLGYVLVQDGAPWPAWSMAFVMVSIAVALIQLDVSLTRKEQWVAMVLMTLGPACTAIACCAWTLYTPAASALAHKIIPVTNISHGLWLIFVLKACGVERQSDGAIFPTKFRTVMYLDVFGWLFRQSQEREGGDMEEDNPPPGVGNGGYMRMPQTAENEYTPVSSPQSREPLRGAGAAWPETTAHPPPAGPCPTRHTNATCSTSVDAEELRQDIEMWQCERVQQVVSDAEKARIERLAEQFHRVAGENAAQQGQQSNPPKGSSSTDIKATREDSRPISTDSLMTTDEPEPDCEQFHEEAPEMPPPPPARWLKLRGHGDIGHEVPYLFKPDTAEVRLLERSASNDDAARLAMSISFTEAKVRTYCDAAGGKSSEPAGASSGQPQQSKEATDKKFRNPLTWCAEPVVMPTSPSMGPLDGMQASSSSGPATLARISEESPLDKPLIGKAQRGLASQSGTADTSSAYRQQHSHHHKQHLQGVGPTAAMLVADAEAFAPVSFFPQGHAVASDNHIAGGEEIVTGHDRTQPGRTPWKVFRTATLLISALWALAFFLSLHPTHSIFGLHVLPLPAVMDKIFGKQETDMSATLGIELEDQPVWEPGIGGRLEVDDLSQGSLVNVDWPRQFAFTPRALSCDSSGRHLVVGDDFGIYTGQVLGIKSGSTSEIHEGASRQDGHTKLLAARFQREPPCLALEGQAIKDMSVVCSPEKSFSCHVLVLVGGGRRLVECPLRGDEVGRTLPVKQNVTWEISSGWLGATHDRLESVAADPVCSGNGVFAPDEIGCIVVGTSSGKVVELRRHISDANRLVPEWAVEERPQPSTVGHGSMQVLPGGFVAVLRPQLGVMQVLDAQGGDEIGNWRLPSTMEWLAVTSSQDTLFFLGRKRKEPDTEPAQLRPQLWAFPIPAQLRERAVSRALAEDSGGRVKDRVQGRTQEM